MNTFLIRILRGLARTFAGLLAYGAIAGAHAQPVSPQPFATIEAEMHTARINHLAADAAGRYAVTASEDKTARVWDMTSGKLLTVLRVPVGEDDEGKLYAAALSPDGRLVALGGWTSPTGVEESIYMFDRASGRLQGRIGGLPQRVNHLAFSADGRHLAAALKRGKGIRIYATRPPWQEVARDADYLDDSNSGDFDRRDRLVVTSYDGKLRLYDAAFRQLAVRELPGGKRPFFAGFSPDGTRIAVGFADSTAVSVVSGEDLRLLYEADTGDVSKGDLSSVTWSADGETLYAAGRNRLPDGRMPLRFWRQQGRGPLQTWPLASATNTVMDLRPLTDGRLVFASADPAWGEVDANGQLLAGQTPPTLDHRGNYDRFRLAASGETVEFLQKTWRDGRWQEGLARFDLNARRLERGVSPQTGLAAPRTDGLPVRDWQGNTGPRIGEQALKLEPDEMSLSLAISSDAQRFALGAHWDLYFFDAAGRRLWQKPVPSVAWLVNLSADGRFVVAALGDGTLRWYRTRDGSEALALFVHADGERWVLWTPEGFYDAAPGADSLLGYRLNQGRDKEGEFVGAGQLASVFYRPDLVARRLAGDEAAISAAVKAVGDVRQVLATGLAPQIELLSPKDIASSGDYELEVRIGERSGGIGRVELRINGKVVDSRADPPTGGMYSQRLSLAEGRNVISAVLYSRDNKQASKPVEAVVNVAPSGEKPTLHVLAVGVTGYRDASLAQGVRFAAGDAAAFAKTLGAQGFAAAAQVATPVVLSDSEATRERIVRELEGFAARVKPADLFVLYLAGHGTSLDDGEYYYLPWELRYTGQAAIKEQALNGPRLQELLARIKASKNLVLLDTCSSGAFMKVAGRDLGDKGSIDRFARLSGRVVLAAAGDRRMALESPDNQRGIFTGALIRGLQGAADTSGNGLVEVGELADYVEKEVSRISLQLFNQEQFPMRETHGQNFPVSRKAQASKP